MYKDSKRTYTVIVLLIKPFVWWRSRCRRRRGLLKLPSYYREGDWERGRICPCETGTREPVSEKYDLVVTVTYIDFQCYTGYKGIYLILKHSRYLTTSERLVSLIRFDPRLSSNDKVARFFLLERATLTVWESGQRKSDWQQGMLGKHFLRQLKMRGHGVTAL